MEVRLPYLACLCLLKNVVSRRGPFLRLDETATSLFLRTVSFLQRYEYYTEKTFSGHRRRRLGRFSPFLQDKKLLSRRNLVAAAVSVRSLDDGLILPLLPE